MSLPYILEGSELTDRDSRFISEARGPSFKNFIVTVGVLVVVIFLVANFRM